MESAKCTFRKGQVKCAEKYVSRDEGKCTLTNRKGYKCESGHTWNGEDNTTCRYADEDRVATWSL